MHHILQSPIQNVKKGAFKGHLKVFWIFLFRKKCCRGLLIAAKTWLQTSQKILKQPKNNQNPQKKTLKKPGRSTQNNLKYFEKDLINLQITC
jgi:hypothetical protein